MKLSSIIVPATLFGVGWASKILPNSHPCSDICQPTEVKCDNKGLEGFFERICKAYRPLIKDCGNCLNKHSSKKRSLEEVALILVLRLTVTLCPEVEPGLISTLPKLGKGALAKALDKTSEFFRILHKILGLGHHGSVAASLTAMMPLASGSDERLGGPAAVVHYAESTLSTVAARETMVPFDPAQAIFPSGALGPAEDVPQPADQGSQTAEDVPQPADQGSQTAEATASATAGAETAYTEEAVSGAEATAPASVEEASVTGEAMASEAATATADIEEASMTAEVTPGAEDGDAAITPEMADDFDPLDDAETFDGEMYPGARNGTIDDFNQTMHGRPSGSGNMSIPESTQRASLGIAGTVMAPKALMVALVVIGLWPAF